MISIYENLTNDCAGEWNLDHTPHRVQLSRELGIREHLKPPWAASALSSFSSICTQASGIALAGIMTNG